MSRGIGPYSRDRLPYLALAKVPHCDFPLTLDKHIDLSPQSGTRKLEHRILLLAAELWCISFKFMFNKSPTLNQIYTLIC